MTTTQLIDKILALPKKKRWKIAKQIINSVLKEENNAERPRFPKNPNNPSPSGDPWFDDPENIRIYEEGFRQASEGKTIPLAECEEYWEMKRIIAEADRTTAAAKFRH